MANTDYSLEEACATPAETQRVLMDLKPALDGFAGIPQESRLLFHALRKLNGVDIEGLIQHGSRVLKAGLSARPQRLTNWQRINRHSRAVVSLHERPYGDLTNTAAGAIQAFFTYAFLRLRLHARRTLSMGIFESTLFSDFIWRTFFSKTLSPKEKELVTSARYRILAAPKKLLFKVGLAGLKFSSTPSFIKLNTRGYDLFVAHTPFPGRVSPETTLVIRYHDAVPILMPHVISDKAFHQASHFYALQDNVRAGAWFCCVSEATRKALLHIFPEVEHRSLVIHNIVSSEYFVDSSPKRMVYQIITNRIGATKEFKTNLSQFRFDGPTLEWIDFDYLLMVSTVEPRKNHALLLQAWEQLKYSSMPALKLVIVGNPGWDHEPIMKSFRPWAERGELLYLNNVPAAELRALYRHAAVTICPSLAEGFDYSGVEAMQCGGVVISSDIPVHREIYEDASEYFDPYSSDHAATVIERVLADEEHALRQRLLSRGQEVSKRYTSSNILPKWEAFIRSTQKLRAVDPRSAN